MAGILVHLGFVLRITPSPLADVFLTLIWVVGVTNAVNLLDNMDGLAAGMAVITAGSAWPSSYSKGTRRAPR